MQGTHFSLGNFCCALVAAIAVVACGGSVQPPNTSPESPTVDSANPSGSAGDAAGTTEPSAKDAAPSAEPAVDNQAKVDIRLDPQGRLLLNDVVSFEKGSAQKLVERLGSPSREKAHKRGETSLYHDRLGLALWAVDDEIGGVGVNFNWDGDDKFPETAFTGSLVLGELSVDKTTTPAQFESLKGYSVSCHGGAMCAGKSESTKFLAGFENGVVTQVSFLPVK